jgi:transport inhibitor response 1
VVFGGQCTDIIGDRGLRQVGTQCKNLKRLVVEAYEAGFVTQHGLMAVARGCFLLEKIRFYAADMTNEALETLAKNCPDLYDVRICLVQKYHDSHPVRVPHPFLHFFKRI